MNCNQFKQTNPDFIVDYCNYAFQSNFNLTNAVKILKKEEKQRGSSKTSDQILYCLYNILTDSLALNTITMELAEINKTKELTQSNKDEFIQSWKNLIFFYQNNSIELH